MDFSFNEEQEELRSIARAFLEERADSEWVRKAMETDLGFDTGQCRNPGRFPWLSGPIQSRHAPRERRARCSGVLLAPR